MKKEQNPKAQFRPETPLAMQHNAII